MLATRPITFNHHTRGVSLDKFAARMPPGVVRVLATDVDLDGNPFVSAFEGLPPFNLFAWQFHPEKAVCKLLER